MGRSALLAAALLLAGARAPAPAVPWTGEPAVQETVAEIMARPEPIEGPARSEKSRKEADRSGLPVNAASAYVSQWPPSGGGNAAVAQPTNPQTVSTSFLGAQSSDSGFVPPDTMGAAGPSQILICVNGRIRVFDKTGAVGALNTSTDNFFTSVRNLQGTSDPCVRYDRLSTRWFVSMINVASTSNRVLLAVSDGPTISLSTVWSFYFFTQDAVSPAGDTNLFADFPQMGVDANAITIGCDMFNATFQGTTGFVIRKSSVLSGGPIVVTAFRQMATSSGAGPYAPHGVDNDDSAATESYFVGVDNATFGTLMFRRISTPGGTPTISGNISLSVPATAFPINVPAQGSTHPLDGLEDRLSGARMVSGNLWTAHNIQVDTSGVASNTGGRNGSRWYEITGLTGTPSLVQSGTLFDAAASNPRSFWMPSCTASGQGHMALGCSAAGSAERAEVAVAGRLVGDAAGTIQAPTIAVTSSTNYNIQSTTPQRWGDYSRMCVDPQDDMTFWAFQEYCNATNSWGVRVIKLLAPPPATPTTCSPANVSQGAAGVNVVVTGTVVAGSGFFDPGPSFPNHVTAAVGGSGVTVNSVTYTDPTHVTMNITVAAGASVGAQTVTITNPDGQSQSSAVGILTIDFVSTPPASVVAVAPTAGYCGGTGLEGLALLALFGIVRRSRRDASR